MKRVKAKVFIQDPFNRPRLWLTVVRFNNESIMISTKRALRRFAKQMCRSRGQRTVSDGCPHPTLNCHTPGQTGKLPWTRKTDLNKLKVN